MTPMEKKQQDADVEGNVEIFMRHPIGLSTLDLLARASLDNGTDQAVHVSSKVRREMQQLAKLEMAESLRTQQPERLRVNDMNTLGLLKDPSPLGGRMKKHFVHGTAEKRKLIAGKFLRSTDFEDSKLSFPASAPELSHAIVRQVKQLKASAESNQDALDLALNCATNATHKSEQKTIQIRELNSAEKERDSLRHKENQLQEKLLLVTKKLTRKYVKQLRPQKGLETTCKVHDLAQKWEKYGLQHVKDTNFTALDDEQYTLYAAGRFSTQMELDYYARKIEPREPATDKHRRSTMHSKYGNALARSKCSLRGPF